jgi:hypothetical protein
MESLRAAARRETRGRRLAWLGVVALLTLGPLAFNLARESSFNASRVMVPVEVRPYPAIRHPGYYSGLLGDPELRRQTNLHADDELRDLQAVTVRPASTRTALVLTVAAETPESARTLVNVIAPQMANATRRQLTRVANKDAERLRARVLRTDLSTERRRTLRARLRRLEELGRVPPSRVRMGGDAPLPPISRWADRLVDDLPGGFARRPSPVWAALAGLLVAAALWATSWVLLPPGGRRADVRQRVH